MPNNGFWTNERAKILILYAFIFIIGRDYVHMQDKIDWVLQKNVKSQSFDTLGWFCKAMQALMNKFGYKERSSLRLCFFTNMISLFNPMIAYPIIFKGFDAVDWNELGK